MHSPQKTFDDLNLSTAMRPDHDMPSIPHGIISSSGADVSSVRGSEPLDEDAEMQKLISLISRQFAMMAKKKQAATNHESTSMSNILMLPPSKFARRNICKKI